jgi:hypothetical protein
MPFKVYGCFLTEEEAVHAVDSLELKGYRSRNITIFTNLSNPQRLEKHTDVKVESSLAEPPEKSTFMDKVRKVFIHNTDEYMNIYDKLTSRGIPKEEAKKCIADVEAGYILVIADDALRMGHAPQAPEPFEEAR